MPEEPDAGQASDFVQCARLGEEMAGPGDDHEIAWACKALIGRLIQ